MGEHLLSSTESVLFDTIADGAILIDSTGRILQFNKACETIFGYRPEEVIGSNVSVLMPESPALQHDSYTSSYFRTLKDKAIGTRREFRGRRKDGSLFPMELSIGEYRQEQAATFIGIIRDISERKALEEKLATQTLLLRRSLDREREMNTMHREFTNMAAHEFRTPLAIIDAAAQRLTSRIASLGTDDEEIGKRLTSIRSAVKRMSTLISSTLDVAKLDGEAFEFSPARIDLSEVVLQIAGRLNDLVEGDRIRLACSLEDPDVLADSKMLEHIVENLIANACKYSPDDSPVHVRLSGTDNVVELTVTDRGRGIPMDEIEKVFDRYFRGESSHGTVGTGLGLYMCRRFVEMHGGIIQADSTPGEETTFTVRLPRQLRNDQA
ncbi:MAG: PAS domain-containing sensor histidine kinase [Rhodospirillales bacterium]